MDFLARTITRFLLPTVLLCLAPIACAAPATTRPTPGLTYTHEIRKDPALHLHILTIDLTNPAVHITVSPAGPDPDGEGPWETTLMTVREIATRDKLTAAVNGDFFIAKDSKDLNGKKFQWFEGNWARVCGPAMTDGQCWSARQEDATLIVDDKQHLSITHVTTIPANARQIVSGSTQVVTKGKKTAAGEDRAPRTAAGLDADAKTLIILVADGRRPKYSEGLTLPELAEEMLRLHCANAINLDGGGSSTMVMRDERKQELEVKNRPSDGHDFPGFPLSIERPIANVLGVRIDRPTTP